MLLENGTYRAVVKDISIYLRGENERLTAAFRVECEGKELVHREWLELNDGTISDKTIKRLRACFPKWDGNIETLEQGFCVQDVEVDITVENEQDKQDASKWWTRSKFMDPPGGSSGGVTLPEKENRATLVSKYGARFRALAGGSQVSGVRGQASGGKAVENRPQTGKGPAERAPAARPAAPSSLEACWEALCKKHPDELREQVSERWFGILEKAVPGKDQADFSPEDWGQILAAITVPF